MTSQKHPGTRNSYSCKLAETRRTANFTSAEKEFLLDVMHKYLPVVECKRTHMISVADKSAKNNYSDELHHAQCDLILDFCACIAVLQYCNPAVPVASVFCPQLLCTLAAIFRFPQYNFERYNHTSARSPISGGRWSQPLFLKKKVDQ